MTKLAKEVELLTVDEVAQLLRVSRHTVYRLAGNGEIPGRKIGRSWRFIRTELLKYLHNQNADGSSAYGQAKGEDQPLTL